MSATIHSITDPLPESKGILMLRKKRAHLTYVAPGAMALEDLLEEIRAMLRTKDYRTGEYSLCEERGVARSAGVEHLHYHVALEIVPPPGKKIQICSPQRLLAIAGVEPDVRVVGEEKHWRYLFLTYHIKEGLKRLQAPGAPMAWTKADKEDRPQFGYTDVEEVVRRGGGEAAVLRAACEAGVGGKSASDVGKIFSVVRKEVERERAREALVGSVRGLRLRPWQVFLDVMRRRLRLDARLIGWLADKLGGLGKSLFAKYLQAMAEEGEVVIVRSWRRDGVCLVISDMLEQNARFDTIVFDLSRGLGAEIQAKHMESLAGVAEEIRDGTIESFKYRSRVITLPTNPVVLVFANFWPDIGPLSRFTLDRWLLCVPGAACEIGHVICDDAGREAIDDIAPLSGNRPEVVPRGRLAAALAVYNSPVTLFGRVPSPEERFELAYRKLQDLFGMEKLETYWEAGYDPCITLQRITVEEELLVPEGPGARPSVEVIGSVYVVPRRMPEERRRATLGWLRDRAAGRDAAAHYRKRLEWFNEEARRRGLPEVEELPGGPPPPVTPATSAYAPSEGARDPDYEDVAAEPGNEESMAPGRRGWAIYCRTDKNDSGPNLEREDLDRQYATCQAYALKTGLAPVSGQAGFGDICPSNTPFDSRPQLAALVASGAAGILCVDCGQFSDGTGDPAGWLRVNGLVFRSVSGS
jgi:hypothetical protein